jgi:5,10-methylenetetrahydromethanopterin reductase
MVEISRLGIGFTGVPYNVNQIVTYAKKAESAGFESIWIAEDYFLRDAITTLTAVALSTNSIKLGTGVINPYTRSPVLIAQTIATLDEISAGRAFLAIGTGVPSLIEQAGIRFEKPLQRIKDSVKIIRQLLTGEIITYDGLTMKISEVKLGYNPYFKLLGSFTPLRNKIMIYVAAIGPKMLELAGQIADGVLLTAGCSPHYVRNAIHYIKLGADKAGRNYNEIDIAGFILTSLPNGHGSRMALRGFLSYVLAYSPTEYLKLSGVSEEEIAQIKNAFFEKGMEEAAGMITDEILSDFAVVGDADTCLSIIEEYVKAGLKLPVILPIDTNPNKLISSLRYHKDNDR